MSLKTIHFDDAKPIAPYSLKDWPQSHKQPLYWTARKTFHMTHAPKEAQLIIAADRHYEIFINGKKAVRQRNFFNGDRYMFAQRWSKEIIDFIKPGENTIDIVVRSDPWKNKNHRCLYPLVLLESAIRNEHETIIIKTDDSWQTAVLDGWRSMIAMGGCGTIHFEQIRLPETEESVLSGVPRPSQYHPAVETDAFMEPPAIYEWTNRPLRTDIHIPHRPIHMSDCEIIDRAIEIDIPRDAGHEPRHTDLVCRFDDSGGREFGLAATMYLQHRILFNGQPVWDTLSEPAERSWCYLAPVGPLLTKPGTNELRLRIMSHPESYGAYRLAAEGTGPIFDMKNWQCEKGWAKDIRSIALSPSERMAALQCSAQNQRVCWSAKTASLLVAAGSPDACAVFDMGQVVSARLSLRIQAETPGQIHLVYGFKHNRGVLDNERMGLRSTDVLAVPAGKSVYEAFDIRVFRYLSLVFEGFTGQVQVDDISIEEDVYIDELSSSLHTSDPIIDRIWTAARRTLQLNANELYVDNPEREHTQWLDGLIYVTTAGYYINGTRVAGKAEKIIEEFIIAQASDGQMPAYAPGAWYPRVPLQCHMSMFVLSCYEYYMNTGNEALARQCLDTILRMIEHWERHRIDGLITDLHTVFVDWGSNFYSYSKIQKGVDPSAIKTGALTTMNAYYLADVSVTAKMSRWLGRRETADDLESIAANLRQAMREKLYDPVRDVFRDGYGLVEAENNVSQTANALAVLFGAAPEGKDETIMRNVLDPDGHRAVIPANSFFAWQFCSALMKADCGELALDWLREKFGHMLDAGPGTFWERMDACSSRVQSSGAAPVMLFAKYLTGIYPAQPGYAALGINPVSCGLNHLKAQLSLPAGAVGAEWTRSGSQLIYDLHLSKGLQGRPIHAPDGMILHVHNE